jgi:hypothetical protein
VAPAAAVVAIFSVTLPVATALLKVIVLFDELKFEFGVVKVTAGKSIAPAGEPVTLAVRVAVPVKPLTTFSVMSSVPDMPCEAIVTGLVDAAVKLKPLTAMVKLAEVAVLPCESVTVTAKATSGAGTTRFWMKAPTPPPCDSPCTA